MTDDLAHLDALQKAYKDAVDNWGTLIRKEEALASVNHSVAEIDAWEQAGRDEDEAREAVKAAKSAYQNALREKFFGF